MNWIEEVVKELNNYMASEVMVGDSPQKRKAIIRGSLVLHAPVIDAEKLGQKMADLFEETEHNLGYGMRSDIKEGFAVRAAQLITDSIDLKNDKE